MNMFIESGIGLLRLFFVLLLPIFDRNINIWGIFYLLQSMIISLYVIAYMSEKLKVKFNFNNLNISYIKDGLQFAIANASQIAYNEIDKVMLARLSTLSNVGVFASATRIINLANLPLFAALGAIYPKFFSNKEQSPHNLAIKILPYTLTYGLIISILIYFMAPFFPLLLGEEFNGTKEALRLLIIIVVLNSMHYPLADAITGGGDQKFRSGLYLISMFENILLNLIFIPKLNWYGAAYSTIITQVTIVLSLSIYTVNKLRSKK